jgi:hypothetical protein
MTDVVSGSSRHPAAISFQFDDEDDDDDNAAAASAAAEREIERIIQQPQEPPPETAADAPPYLPEFLEPPSQAPSRPSQSSRAAPPPELAETKDLDFDFLKSLSNSRKLKKARDDKPLNDNEDIDVYREDPETERQQIERIQRLRREASRYEDDDNDSEEPIRFGEEPPPQPSHMEAFFEDDRSHGSGGSGGGGGKKKKKHHRSRHHHREEEEPPRDDRSDYSHGSHGSHHSRVLAPYEERPVFKPRRSKAELWAEERGHKAKCVARIEQLEAKGISCSLPEEIDWMSLPLAQLDDELTLMETKYKRKGKIVKMRAGFYALNKALTWGLTSHPGPDFLKFPRVKGFDKTVADEIDEFDDPLERLWDLWFGSSGEAHPLIEIALLEAVMLGNHVMRGDQGQNAKTQAGFKTKVDGDKSTSSGATSTTGLMSSLMNMLNQNPGMVGPVADALVDRQQQAQAQQARQQQIPLQQQHQYPQPNYQPAMPPRRGQPINFGDFGVPPVLASDSAAANQHDDDFIAKSRELQQQHIREMREQAAMQKQQQALLLQQRMAEEKRNKALSAPAAAPLSVDDMLRSLMDDVVDKTASGGGGGGGRFSEIVEENDEEPIDVDVEQRGRGGRR